MTKEEKDKIIREIVNERNLWARDCDRRVAEEKGKIIGADYMLERFLDCFHEKDQEAADGNDRKN